MTWSWGAPCRSGRSNWDATLAKQWPVGCGPVPMTATLRVDSAVSGLTAFDSTFVVEAAGDWVNYARLEAIVRVVIVCIGAFFALVVIGIVRMVSVRQFRRAHHSAV